MKQPAAHRLLKATKISCEVDQSLADDAEAALAALNVGHAQVHSRRSVVLRERALLPFLPPTTGLEEDPVEVFEVFVPRPHARALLLAWARALRLFTPGRGAIFAEEVEVLNPPGLDATNTQLPAPADGSTDHAAEHAGQQSGERLSHLSLINCVVQRDQGNAVARCALEIGSHVPTVNFGTGTGVRDRLGLLRIAIPAEKETVSVLVDAHEQADAMDALIEAGRLDLPGRGFIAAYPVAYGLGNPKTFRGPHRYSASMEQVITALDELKAGTDWRRRSGARLRRGPHERAAGHVHHAVLKDLVNLSLVCNEGSSERLVAAVMAAGASGATISRSRQISPLGLPLTVLPGREVIDLGVGPAKVEHLMDALQAAGAFEADTACVVELKPLPTAFTYIAG